MTTDTTPDPPAGVRNATLGDLAGLLRDQQARKVDIVASASAIRARNGQLVIDGTDPVLGPDGVTMTTGTYTPTEVCDQGLADKLGIPVQYLRRVRGQRPALYDANVNAWLDGDPRKFLVRCLRPATGEGSGAARAFLSDGYRRIDNLDVLLAALDGVRQAGVPVQVDGCDLTERRMYVRVVCEQVRALAPALLAGYRSPFTGAAGADNPVVFSGFVLSNSETGCGAFTLTPRLVVQVCRNGMTITRDAIRSVHHGERLDEGVVSWSGNTLDKPWPWSPPRRPMRWPRSWSRGMWTGWCGRCRRRPGARSLTRRRRWRWCRSGCGSPTLSRPRSWLISSAGVT